jgi:hypothetical protein
MAMNVWQAGTHANANNSLTRDALQQTISPTTLFETVVAGYDRGEPNRLGYKGNSRTA